MLDAEHIQRKRLGVRRHDAVFGNDAVLLAAAHQFAGKQKKRTLAAVNEDQAVDRSARLILGDGHGANAAVTDNRFATLLANEDAAAR